MNIFDIKLIGKQVLEALHCLAFVSEATPIAAPCRGWRVLIRVLQRALLTKRCQMPDQKHLALDCLVDFALIKPEPAAKMDRLRRIQVIGADQILIQCFRQERHKRSQQFAQCHKRSVQDSKDVCLAFLCSASEQPAARARRYQSARSDTKLLSSVPQQLHHKDSMDCVTSRTRL